MRNQIEIDEKAVQFRTLSAVWSLNVSHWINFPLTPVYRACFGSARKLQHYRIGIKI